MSIKGDSIPLETNSSPLPNTKSNVSNSTTMEQSTNPKLSSVAPCYPAPNLKFSEQNITRLRGFIDWIKFTKSHFEELKRELVNLNPNASNWYSIRQGSTGRKYHIRIVIGNEGCDLDSFASSLTFSYLYYVKSIVPIINRYSKKELKRTLVDRDFQPHSSRKKNKISTIYSYGCDFIVLPVVFTTRPLLEIRGDCKKACELFGIDMNDMIFIDDLLNFFKAAGDSHNKEAPILNNLARDIYKNNSHSLSPRAALGPGNLQNLGDNYILHPTSSNLEDASQIFQFLCAYIQLDIVLVDQPSIPYLLRQYLLQQTRFLNFQIISIVDHHVSDPSMKPYLAKTKLKSDRSHDSHKDYFYSNVAVCASNMTLMTEEYRKMLSNSSNKLNPYIQNESKYLGPVYGLLLGTILVDSGNLDKSTGKITDKDVDAVNWLSIQIAPFRECIKNLEEERNIPPMHSQQTTENGKQNNKNAVDSNLRRKSSKNLKNIRSLARGSTKRNLNSSKSTELQMSLFTAINASKIAYNTKLDLPASLALEKDFKMYELCAGKGSAATIIYGISSIGMSMKDWIERAQNEPSNHPTIDHKPSTLDEASYNLQSILRAHCKQYDLSFLLIISSYMEEEGNGSKVESSKERQKNYKRQLSVFIPVNSRWILRPSSTNAMAKDLKNDVADDSSRKSTPITDNYLNIRNLLPKHIFFTQFFGQKFIDTVKLVSDNDLPHILLPVDLDLPSVYLDGRPLQEENLNTLSNFSPKNGLMDKACDPIDCIFSVFQQLDITFSRKKVQPLLHQHFAALLH